MQVQGRLLSVLFLLVLVSIMITGCDSEQALDVNPEDVEVVAAEIENTLIQPFDKIRKTEITFEIEGLEKGILKFAADKEIYPEEIEFKSGKVEIDGLLTAREEAKIGVIVKTQNGQQVKELFVDIGDPDKSEFDEIGSIIPQEQNEEKHLGFFVSERFSEDYDNWIYFDNWYIKDFCFFQQFNLVLYLYHERFAPSYFADEFNNRFGTWEEYKVVGEDNLQELDEDFSDFFRKSGYDWDPGILIYLDGEKDEYRSSLDYELMVIDEFSVGGEKDHLHLTDMSWGCLIEALIDDPAFDLEYHLEAIGDETLDGEALKDIIQIRRGEDLEGLEMEYYKEEIEIVILCFDDFGNFQYSMRVGEKNFGQDDDLEGLQTFNKPEYFYRDPEERKDPFMGQDRYNEAIQDEGNYQVIINYNVYGIIDNEKSEVYFAPICDRRISLSASHEVPDYFPPQVKEVTPIYGLRDDVEGYRIEYESDGFLVVGYMVRPAEEGQFPILVYNRGGNMDFGKITYPMVEQFFSRLAGDHGYVVIASQYRGAEGGEGQDEYGGADINDVFNIIDIGQQLPFTIDEDVVMLGFSRGGLMTYLSIKKETPLKAAAVWGGVSDLAYSYERREEEFKQILEELIGGCPETLPDEYSRRSAIDWPEKIDVPVLILHGGEDWRVCPDRQAEALAKKFEDLGREKGEDYDIKIFEGDDHAMSENVQERDKMTLDWFGQHLD